VRDIGSSFKLVRLVTVVFLLYSSKALQLSHIITLKEVEKLNASVKFGENA